MYKGNPITYEKLNTLGYVKRMITKEGITDAIIKSLLDGEPLDTSLRKGIARSKEISLEIEKSIG